MHEIRTTYYTRISKAAARKAYIAGNTVYFCPVKMHPENMYIPAVPVRNDSPRRWEDIINNFERYNCTTETGKYTAFYIKNGNNAMKEAS